MQNYMYTRMDLGKTETCAVKDVFSLETKMKKLEDYEISEELGFILPSALVRQLKLCVNVA